MKTTRLILLLSVTTLFSCKQELMPQESSSTPADSTAVAATPGQDSGMPQAQTLPMTQSPQTSMTASPAPVAAGLNPAHGQPGHRCDIAVGAPLNSPAAATPAASTPQKVTNSPMTISSSQITPTATKTAAGMNPPHGQDGHRCDIAVGAPLSTPATTTTTTTSVPDLLATPSEPVKQ